MTELDSRNRPRQRAYVNKKRTAETILERDENGRKHCIWGDHWVPETWFSKNKGPDGLHSYCRRCITAIKHNLTINEFNQLLANAKNRCMICKCIVRFDSKTRSKPAIDHDHNCCPGPKSCGSCVRGILCFDCNNGLGNFYDSIPHLENAIQYLKETSK